MSRKGAHPSGFDFAELPQPKAITGIQFTDEESELQDQTEAQIEQPSPVISADDSDRDVFPLLRLLKTVPAIVEAIANKLDPESFLNLACSSTEFYHFFTRPTAKNFVSIPLTEDKLEFYLAENRFTYESQLVPVPMSVGGPTLEKYVEMTRKWPFRVHLDRVSFEGDFEDVALMLGELLLFLGAATVRKLRMGCPLPFDDLCGLIHSYAVKELDLLDSGSMYTDEEWIALGQMPLDTIYVDECPVDLLELSSISTIFVDNEILNTAVLRSIVQRWLQADDLLMWRVGSAMAPADFINAFSEFCFYSSDYKGALPEHRPLFFIGRNEYQGEEDLSMFIYREDGRLLKVETSRAERRVLISFCSLTEGPAILEP